MVDGGQLQVEAKIRVCHTAAGKKGAAKECDTAAFFFQNGVIDMVGDSCRGVPAEGAVNSGYFLPV